MVPWTPLSLHTTVPVIRKGSQPRQRWCCYKHPHLIKWVLPLLSEATRGNSAKNSFATGFVSWLVLDSRHPYGPVPGGPFILPALRPVWTARPPVSQSTPKSYKAYPAFKWEVQLSFLCSFTNQALPLQFLIPKHLPHIRRKYCVSWFLSLHHLKISFGLFSCHLPILRGSFGLWAKVFPFQIELWSSKNWCCLVVTSENKKSKVFFLILPLYKKKPH